MTSSRKSSISSNSASAGAASPRRLHWPGVAGIGLSIVLLWWALRDVALADVLTHVRRARAVPFLIAVALATLAFPLRTVRWRYLLRLEGATLNFTPLWHATAVGFMANNLLPARAGEFARAYTARQLTGVRFTAAIGSIGVERVMDGLTLAGLLVAAITWGGLTRTTMVGGVSLQSLAIVAAAVFIPALGVALFVVHRPDTALGIARRLVQRLLSERWAARLLELLEGVILGLDALRSPRRFAFVALWSVILWVVAGLSYYAAFLAFRLSAPLSAAFLLQSLIGFGVVIPSSPGFFGPFEAVTRATLAIYVVPAAAAVSFAVAFHIATFLPITALGLWSLSRAHLHLADLRREGPP